MAFALYARSSYTDSRSLYSRLTCRVVKCLHRKDFRAVRRRVCIRLQGFGEAWPLIAMAVSSE